jgi:type II secretory pathway pseudopilin PulG
MPLAILSSIKRLFGFRLIALMVIGTGITFLVPVVARHHKFSAQLKIMVSQIRAAKEPVTLEELNAYYVEVPADQNAAKIYAHAFDAVEKSGSAKFLKAAAELPQGTNALPDNVREQMKNAVTNCGAALESLRKAAAIGACRYPVDYTPGWYALMPHLPALSACAHLETCNGVLKEQSGDTDAAIQSVGLILKYAASLNSEPDLISVLIQQRLDIQAGDLTRWIINHQKLSTGQLAKLQQVFGNSERTNWIDRSIIGERCSALAMFDYPATDFLDVISPNHQSRWDKLGIWFHHFTGQMKQDEVTYLSRLDDLREMARLPFPERLDVADTLYSEIRNQGESQSLLATGAVLPPLVTSISRDAQYSARIRLIQAALAIEQFRAAHSAPPNTLDELMPDYLTNIPLDPFDGNQLRYNKTAQGYLLYSIGPDRVDDGGRNPLPLISKGNIPVGDITLSVRR